MTRKAVRDQDPEPGRDDRRVVIVGGGLAGLAAAEVLSRDAGGQKLDVLLLEARRTTGGRAGSFQDGQTGDAVDYCQHVAMGCCTNFIDLLERFGLTDQFSRYDELFFVHRNGRRSRFRGNPYLPAPLHLLGSFGRLKHLSWNQKRQVARATFQLMRCRPDQVRHSLAGDWLRHHGQSESTIRDFWDVFLVSALGELTDRVTIAAARKVMIDGFASSRRATELWVPRRPLAELFGDSAVDLLRERGVAVTTSAPVQEIDFRDGTFRIDGPSGTLATAAAVILAVPWHTLDRMIWNERERLPVANREQIAAIPASPISGIHLWFDRAIMDRPHAVLVGTLSQWVFGDPMQGTNSTGGQSDDGRYYCQVVISASGAMKETPRSQWVAIVLRELGEVFPAARAARLLHSRIVTDPNSVFSIRPEVEALRPVSSTDQPGLFVAGDWVRTGWPATMEGAIRGGRLAAAEVQKFLDGRPVPLTPDLAPGWLASRLIVPALPGP